MKKKLLFILIVFIFSLTATATAVYAYFTTKINNSFFDDFTAQQEQQTNLINNEYELRLYAFDKYNNTDKQVSTWQGQTNQGQRSSLKLNADIVLSYDLEINRDINIDFNTHAIDLNGHAIAISHHYHGALLLLNGSLQSSKSGAMIVYDTPNAYLDDTTIVIAENITKTILSQNENDLVNRVFEYVEDNFDDYYCSDIPLITNYYNSGIAFLWNSNIVDLVSPSGDLQYLPMTEQTVELTLTLSHDSFSDTHTNSYQIIIVASGDSLLDYGEQQLDSFFENYKYGTENIYIYNNVELPLANNYYDLSYFYSTMNNDNLIAEHIINKGVENRQVTLSVLIDNNKGQTKTKDYILNIVVENNLDVANNIINDMDIFIVSNDQSTIDLPELSQLLVYGIQQLPNYTFINNNNNYHIEDNQIVVDTLPDTEEEIYLRMGFSFVANTPLYVERDVRIFFVDASGFGGDESYDRYSYHYYLLDEMIAQKTAGETYQDFTLPSEYLGMKIEYLLENVPENAINIVSDPLITLFDFDASYVPPQDSLIRVKYLFEGAVEAYTRHSAFILPGIINNNNQGIPDINLYNAVLDCYDTDNDNVLTLVETLASKQWFVLDDYAEDTVNSFQGIEYLKKTAKLNFDNHNFNKSQIAYLNEMDGILELSLQSCNLTNNDIDMFYVLKSLEILDISNNSITNLDNLFINNTVTKLLINDNLIEDIEGLAGLNSIEIIYLQNNPIKLYKSLLDMEGLTTVYNYNQITPIIDTNYGAQGAYNYSYYVLLGNRSVEVYNGYVSDLPILFSCNTDVQTGLEILQSIFYYSYSQNVIEVPTKIYQTQSVFYQIIWDYDNLNNSISSENNGIITIAHDSSPGTYEIYAYVVINGYTSYRIFFIEAQ